MSNTECYKQLRKQQDGSEESRGVFLVCQTQGGVQSLGCTRHAGRRESRLPQASTRGRIHPECQLLLCSDEYCNTTIVVVVTLLIITSGISCGMYPFRFYAPTQIHLPLCQRYPFAGSEASV